MLMLTMMRVPTVTLTLMPLLALVRVRVDSPVEPSGQSKGARNALDVCLSWSTRTQHRASITMCESGRACTSFQSSPSASGHMQPAREEGHTVMA